MGVSTAERIGRRHGLRWQAHASVNGKLNHYSADSQDGTYYIVPLDSEGGDQHKLLFKQNAGGVNLIANRLSLGRARRVARRHMFQMAYRVGSAVEQASKGLTVNRDIIAAINLSKVLNRGED